MSRKGFVLIVVLCMISMSACGSAKKSKVAISTAAETTTTSATSTTTTATTMATNNTTTTTCAPTTVRKTSATTQKKTTAKITNVTTKKTTQLKTTATTKLGTKKVVQMADPNTGISWDGVSKIIYTYPDGTKGYEKRVGATYEQGPGIYTTVDAETTIAHMSDYELAHCKYCGKLKGDGRNGTCERHWAGGDWVCPYCHKTVHENECHTCK